MNAIIIISYHHKHKIKYNIKYCNNIHYINIFYSIYYAQRCAKPYRDKLNIKTFLARIYTTRKFAVLLILIQ